MTRTNTLWLALSALAILVASFGVSASEPQLDAQELPVAEQSVAVDAQVPDLNAEPKAETSELTISFESALEAAINTTSYECPPSTTYCWRDSQCDSFCGGSGGSCTFGCCYCAF